MAPSRGRQGDGARGTDRHRPRPVSLVRRRKLLAAADPGALQQSCTQTVSGSECESPGNVEINDTPPAMNYDPYGDDGFLMVKNLA